MSDITTSLMDNGHWSASASLGSSILTVYDETEQKAREKLERRLEAINRLTGRGLTPIWLDEALNSGGGSYRP